MILSPLDSTIWKAVLPKEEFDKWAFCPWSDRSPNAQRVRDLVARAHKNYDALKGIRLGGVEYDEAAATRLLKSGDRHYAARRYDYALKDYYEALWILCAGEYPFGADAISRLNLLEKCLAKWEKCASWIDQDMATNSLPSSLWIVAARLWLCRYRLNRPQAVANLLSPLAYALRRKGHRDAALKCIAWALAGEDDRFIPTEKGKRDLLEIKRIILGERGLAREPSNISTAIKTLRRHPGFQLQFLGRISEKLIRTRQTSAARMVGRIAESILKRSPQAHERARRRFVRIRKLLDEHVGMLVRLDEYPGPIQELLETALQALRRGNGNAAIVLIAMAIENITSIIWAENQQRILASPHCISELRGYLGGKWWAKKRGIEPKDMFPHPDGWSSWNVVPSLELKNRLLKHMKVLTSETSAWIAEVEAARNMVAHGNLKSESVEHPMSRIDNLYDWLDRTMRLLAQVAPQSNSP